MSNISTNAYNTKTTRHDSGLFLRYDIDTETGYSKYRLDIINKDEQHLFTDLCEMMIPFWNSIKYKNLAELADSIGLSSVCRLSTKLVALEKLKAIKRSNGYLYINPYYASKSADIKESTLALFNITMAKVLNNSNRNKVDVKNILNIPY